jgi:hypothetical protein
MGKLDISFLSLRQKDLVGILRLRMVVAPMDLRKSVCVREVVVMIGENPESFASRMTVQSTLVSIKSWEVKLSCEPHVLRTPVPAHTLYTFKRYKEAVVLHTSGA